MKPGDFIKWEGKQGRVSRVTDDTLKVEPYIPDGDFFKRHGPLVDVSRAKVTRTSPLPTRGLFRAFLDAIGLSGQKKRAAFSMSAVYDAAWELLWARGYYFLDAYVDENTTYAIGATYDGASGGLFRFPITITADGVEIGAEEPVSMEFMPRSKKGSLNIFRGKDGVVRWTCIAGVTQINRSGQIDSSKLFQGFSERAGTSDPYPYLTFFHCGEKLRMGQADFVALSDGGIALLVGGTFDMENELARSMIEAIERDGDFWGVSIGFLPDQAPSVELIGGIPVAIYESGELIECSFLPEHMAASYMTNISVTRSNQMSKQLDAALLKAFNGNEEQARAWAEKADEVDRAVVASGVVTRTEGEDPEPEEGGDTEGQEFVLTDDAIAAITQSVLNSEPIKALTTRNAELENANKTLLGKLEAAEKRLTALEKPEAVKKQDWLADVPRSAKQIVVTTRPSAAQSRITEAAKPTTPEFSGHALNGL